MHMSELDAQIRQRAYAIWEESGRPEGCERQHWEQAAREVLSSGRKAGDAQPAKGRRVAKTAGAKGRARKAA
jgi:hypothetical protein